MNINKCKKCCFSVLSDFRRTIHFVAFSAIALLKNYHNIPFDKIDLKLLTACLFIAIIECSI